MTQDEATTLRNTIELDKRFTGIVLVLQERWPGGVGYAYHDPLWVVNVMDNYGGHRIFVSADEWEAYCVYFNL